MRYRWRWITPITGPTVVGLLIFSVAFVVLTGLVAGSWGPLIRLDDAAVRAAHPDVPGCWNLAWRPPSNS